MFKHLKLTVFGVLISTMAIGQVGVRKDVKYPEKGRSPKPESALQAESDHATLGQKPKAKSITKGTVIFSEDFSAGVMPPEFILYNWDGLTPAPNVSFVDAAWVVEPDLMDSTNYAAFSTSWYNPVGTADDWMILPKMQIPAGAILNWNAIAYDGSFADGYQVLVSTGDSATSSFTDTLFSVAGENDAWTSRSASLNDFSGQDVYIAFRNNSFDKFLLAVDDIQVYLPPPYDIGVTEVTEPNNDSNCELTANEDVSVVIESFGSDTITNGFDVHYTINGGTPVSETISDTLLPGQLMNYTFNTKADLSVYQDYAIEAYTSYAQDNDTVNDTASTSVVSSDAQLSIRIHTDSYPSEISWELLDNNNQLVAESPAYTVPDTTYTTNVCVLASSCLTLNIYDSFGDGILPPGGYEVYLDTVLVDSNFSFDSDMATVYHIGNGCPANDLSVEQVYALGKAPKDGGSPLSVKAIINNWGTAGQTNKNVVLDISGANTYQDTVAISSINSLESDTVTFQNINPASLGAQDIAVSVEDDEYNSNNTGHYYQEITANTYNHADTSAIEQGIGFNTGAGMMVAKYHVYGTKSVKAASVNVSGGAAGNQLYGVLLDAKGNILSTGDPVSITAADTNNYVQLPVNPFNVTDQDIYVGFAQMENATNGFFPLNIQTEEPGRPDAFFYVGGLSGGTLTNSADLGRWMLEGVIDAPISDDAMITGISEIKTACTMDSVDLEIGIYNNGMDTISNIEVGYMLNGGVPVTENISSNINPRDTMMHTFSTALDVSSFGYYEIKAFVELAADTIQKNDTTMHDFYNVEPSDIPYSTSFSSSGDNYAWTLIDGNDDGIAPVIDDVGVANTGTNVVSVLGGEGKQDEYVISRCLNLKAGKSYELSYYHRVGDFLGTPIPEDMHIVMGTSPEPAALTTLIADPPAVDAIDFVPMAHDFNVAQDGVYYIAFNITTDSPWIYLLDDVAVTDVSSIEQQAENRINIYPNPANDILNIVGDGLVIEQIQVYNTMGQLMFATSVNDNNARLNVHEYTPGMYFVQMQTEQGTITRKVQVK